MTTIFDKVDRHISDFNWANATGFLDNSINEETKLVTKLLVLFRKQLEALEAQPLHPKTIKAFDLDSSVTALLAEKKDEKDATVRILSNLMFVFTSDNANINNNLRLTLYNAPKFCTILEKIRKQCKKNNISPPSNLDKFIRVGA